MTRRFALLTKTSVGVALALGAGAAMAESQYGYASAGTGPVSAQAKVNLKVTVPKLILLRVGSTTTGGDELAWTAALSIPGVPTTPTDGNNKDVNWSGAAPTAGTMTNPAALAVYAWTNSSGGGTLSYAATAFTAGGPALGDVSVTNGAGLAHPAPLALAATSSTATTFTRNTAHTGSWTYALNGTNAANWAAGSYSATVTYTASSL
jgi:hypothetical protein